MKENPYSPGTARPTGRPAYVGRYIVVGLLLVAATVLFNLPAFEVRFAPNNGAMPRRYTAYELEPPDQQPWPFIARYALPVSAFVFFSLAYSNARRSHYRPIRGWKPTTSPVTSTNYAAVTAAHQNVAIHFWAQWNGVDPPFDRAIRDLPPEIRALVHFVSCNIDDPQNASLATDLSIATIPTLALVVDGKPHGLIVGQRSPDELATELISRIPLPIVSGPK